MNRKQLKPVLLFVFLAVNLSVSLYSALQFELMESELIGLARYTVGLENQITKLDADLSAYEGYLSYLGGELTSLTSNEPRLGFEVHLKAYHRDELGNLKTFSEHAGLVPNIGLDWVEDQLGDSPGTDPAKWISLTNSTDSPAAGWTSLPYELDAEFNLTRAAGVYASTGVGSWTITQTFYANATITVNGAGLHWASSGDNNLFAADTITAANMENGDSIELEFTITAANG